MLLLLLLLYCVTIIVVTAAAVVVIITVVVVAVAVSYVAAASCNKALALYTNAMAILYLGVYVALFNNVPPFATPRIIKLYNTNNVFECC